MNTDIEYNNKLNLLKNLSTVFNIINKKIYTEEDYIKAINSNISIEELFKTNNIKTDIKYFIMSMPKTGNNYLKNGILSLTSDVVFYHSIIDFLVIDLRFINFNIKNIIEYISLTTKYNKLYIIVSYREPLLRYISRYLWDIKLKIKNNNILNNINIINEEIYNNIKNDDYNIVYDLIKDKFNINLSNYKYNNEKGFSIINYNNKIDFLFTIINDIDKLFINFFNINPNNNSFFKNKNELNDKEILFDENIKKIIYENEKDSLLFYNMYN